MIAPDGIFKIFNDSLLKSRYIKICTYAFESGNTGICPLFYKPDYGVLHFVCLSETDSAYKVLINYSDIKYLAKNKANEFKTWEEYILESNGVRATYSGSDGHHYDQALKKGPSDDAEKISVPKGDAKFCPLEVEGDWVKVTFNCFHDDYAGDKCLDYIGKCKNPITGWLRWRDGNKLLIAIAILC